MRASLIILTLVITTLAGCLSGDKGGDDILIGDDPADLPFAHSAYDLYSYRTVAAGEAAVPEAWMPPAYRELPSKITGLAHLEHVTGVSGGAGIAIFGHYAFVGPTRGPLNVVDIADPAAPNVVATVEGVPARDGDTFAFPDGRIILVTTAGGGKFFVTDVTDPTQPKLLVEQDAAHNVHNLAIVPGTPIFYNSVSGGTATDIWDLSDPAKPVMVQDWENGRGCHDITFYISHEDQKYRAYCAGVRETQIWDITDPLAPSVITSIPNPPEIRFGLSHLAMVNHDASVLIMGDETGGGAIPGCDYYAENPATGETMSGPNGNLYFYDLADEANPVLKSYMSVNQILAPGSCTAHFGHVIEDRNQLVMAYYAGGVALIDFNDLENPKLVDQWMPLTTGAPGSAWDAWFYQGYVFTGDIQRVMDALTFA